MTLCYDLSDGQSAPVEGLLPNNVRRGTYDAGLSDTRGSGVAEDQYAGRSRRESATGPPDKMPCAGREQQGNKADRRPERADSTPPGVGVGGGRGDRLGSLPTE